MKENKIEFEVNDKKYTMIFNLNVMQEIQEEYGTIENWGNLTDGKNAETNVKALIFGIKAMINEAIDIENENATEKKSYMNDKQIGRLITAMGMKNATEKLSEAVISGTNSTDSKNE